MTPKSPFEINWPLVDDSFLKLVASKYVIVVIVFVAYLPQPDPVFRSPQEVNFCFGNL